MNLSFESPHTGGLDSAGSLVCYSDFMFYCSMVTWEMERKSWLTADICFLCSLCLSFTYNLPFFSHSKYQYLDVFLFFNLSLLFFLFLFLSVGSVSKLAVHVGRRAGAKKYGQQLPRSAGFEGTDCTFFVFPLPPRWSSNWVATQLSDLIHIQITKRLISHFLLWGSDIRMVLTGFLKYFHHFQPDIYAAYRLERFHWKGLAKIYSYWKSLLIPLCQKVHPIHRHFAVFVQVLKKMLEFKKF